MKLPRDLVIRALAEAVEERTPDFSGAPDHVFSAEFENRMKTLFAGTGLPARRNRRPAVKRALVAAAVLLLAALLSLSVSGVRDAVIHFFVRHFDGYDEIVFEESGRTKIETEYGFPAPPEGFRLSEELKLETLIRRIYENDRGEYLVFEQKVAQRGGENSIDNERTRFEIVEIDGTEVYAAVNGDFVTLFWERDGYVLSLETKIAGNSLRNAIDLYRVIDAV